MKILVIDDDLDLLITLRIFLEKNDMTVVTAENGMDGLKALDESMDLVICDLRLPDFTGLEILQKIKKVQPSIPVILVTGYADVKTAVKALQYGASDYVTKPLYPDELLLRIHDIESENKRDVNLESEKASKKNKSKASSNSLDNKEWTAGYFEGKTPKMASLYKNIKLVAPTDLSVVILGETGSGKEVVAKRLHSLSDRRSKPFLALDCGALPAELASSELFGYRKGAFTGADQDKAGIFEAVNGGTLFLDEIGNLQYENQVKLLRVLQEKKVTRLGDTKEVEVDFRLLVATNENMVNDVREGKFREDLYYRLNEFSLKLPPLRERGSDLMLYARYFLDSANQRLRKNIQGFSEEVENKFAEYAWPGNLRELNNVVKRAVLICEKDQIELQHVPMDFFSDQMDTDELDIGGLTLKEAAAIAEKKAIVAALRSSQFNKTTAAQLLDIDRRTLYNKMQLYKIEL